MRKLMILTGALLIAAAPRAHALGDSTIPVFATGRAPFKHGAFLPARGAALKDAHEEMFLEACAKAIKVGRADWTPELQQCITLKFLPRWRDYLASVRNNPTVVPTRNERNPEPDAAGRDSICVVACNGQFNRAELRHDLLDEGCFAPPTSIGGDIAVYVREWSRDNSSLLDSETELALMNGLRQAGFKPCTLNKILKTAKSRRVFDSIYKRAWSAAYAQDAFVVTPWGAAGWWSWGYMEGGVEYHSPAQILDFSKADLLLTGKAVVESSGTGRAVARITLELVRLKDKRMAVLAEASATGIGTGAADSHRALKSAADQALEQILGDLMDSGVDGAEGSHK